MKKLISLLTCMAAIVAAYTIHIKEYDLKNVTNIKFKTSDNGYTVYEIESTEKEQPYLIRIDTTQNYIKKSLCKEGVSDQISHISENGLLVQYFNNKNSLYLCFGGLNAQKSRDIESDRLILEENKILAVNDQIPEYAYNSPNEWINISTLQKPNSIYEIGPQYEFKTKAKPIYYIKLKSDGKTKHSLEFIEFSDHSAYYYFSKNCGAYSIKNNTQFGRPIYINENGSTIINYIKSSKKYIRLDIRESDGSSYLEVNIAPEYNVHIPKDDLLKPLLHATKTTTFLHTVNNNEGKQIHIVGYGCMINITPLLDKPVKYCEHRYTVSPKEYQPIALVTEKKGIFRWRILYYDYSDNKREYEYKWHSQHSYLETILRLNKKPYLKEGYYLKEMHLNPVNNELLISIYHKEKQQAKILVVSYE